MRFLQNTQTNTLLDLDMIPPSKIQIQFLALILFLFCFSQAEGQDWYRWRGPDGNGVATVESWNSDWSESPPKIAWKTNVGTGYSSVVERDGRAYTMGHADGEDTVYCLNVDDGSVIWKQSYTAELGDRDFEGGPTSTPTIDGDRVYALGRDGELFCFDAQQGNIHWQVQLVDVTNIRLPGWGLASSPLVVNDQLLIGYGESGVAVDKMTGELLWQSKDREYGYATPALIPESDSHSKETIAVMASGKSFIGVDVKSGEPRWSVRWLTSFNCNAAAPIFHDGKMFLCSGYSRGAGLFDLAADEPKLIWKSKEMKNQIHASVLYEGHLYGIHGDMESGAELRCMDWQTGEIIWSEPDQQPGGLSLVNNTLVLQRENGEVVLSRATPDGWNPHASKSVLSSKSWTSPVLSNGRLFCRSVDGEVACLDCRK